MSIYAIVRRASKRLASGLRRRRRCREQGQTLGVEERLSLLEAEVIRLQRIDQQQGDGVGASVIEALLGGVFMVVATVIGVVITHWIG